MKLTEADVMQAVGSAARGADGAWSAYVAGALNTEHRARCLAGGKGYPPRRSLILARLKSLECKGQLERSHGTNGYYGYYWRITDLGRAALAQQEGRE